MNKLTIIGRLTRDPELRTVTIGGTEVKVATFSVAVNRKNHAGNQTADFFKVTAWRGLGEACAAYLAKGRQVCVTGAVKLDSYMNNGNMYNQLAVTADEVEFLGTAQKTEDAPAETEAESDADDILGL